MKKLSVSLKESRFVDLINKKKFTDERRKEDGIKVKTCLNTEIFLKNPESKYDDLIEYMFSRYFSTFGLKFSIGTLQNENFEDLKNFKIPYKYLVYDDNYRTSLMCEFVPYSKCEGELEDKFKIYNESDYNKICRSISEKLKDAGEILEYIPKEKYVDSYVIGDYLNPHLSADRYTRNYQLCLMYGDPAYEWFCKNIDKYDGQDYIGYFKDDIIYEYPELKYEDFIVWSYEEDHCNIGLPLNINNLNNIKEYCEYTKNWFTSRRN